MSRVIGILLSLFLVVGASSLHAAESNQPVLLVYGDSVSAGLGISVESGWVSLLAKRLRMEGYGFRVVNASVSGETTAGGLARLPRALATHKPKIVLLELGANDGLRALPLTAMRDNLDRMIQLAGQSGRKVLLIGMRMPPNYGPRYTTGFEQIYRELARKHGVALVPFLMDKVADQEALMQADGLHPNVQGQPQMLSNVWSSLVKLLGPTR
jgi:acyl-CoA thioesterase-1